MRKSLQAGASLLIFAFILLFLLVYLPEIFAGRQILDPVAFSIYSFSVKWYGILIALGALVAYLFINDEAKRRGIDRNTVESAVLVALIFGLIGARLGFVIQNVSYFLASPLEIFNTRLGGLSIHGALILGLVALYLYLKKSKKVQFGEIIDLVSPAVLLAIAIGRWGNLFNYEIVGQPTDFLWKMFVPLQYRVNDFSSSEFFHPVFLYESVLLAVLFIIYRLYLREKEIGFVYAFVGYCDVRIFVEFFRIDYRPIFVGLDLAQIVSFVIIIAVLLINQKIRAKNGKS